MATAESTSSARAEANRRNAQKSTGPKDTSRTRLNALKHGLLTKEILLKGEDKQALERLGKRLRVELAPKRELESILVDRIVSSAWRLKRALKVEADFLEAQYEDCKYDDYNEVERSSEVAWGLVVTRHLGGSHSWSNLVRYETAIEKQIYRALNALHELQSARRRAEKAPAATIHQVVSTDL